MVDKILSGILYGLSGYLFGIFGSRMALKSLLHFREHHLASNHNLTTRLLLYLITSAVIFMVWALFPYFFYRRTDIGGIIYIGTLLYYLRVFYNRNNMLSSKNNKANPPRKQK